MTCETWCGMQYTRTPSASARRDETTGKFYCGAGCLKARRSLHPLRPETPHDFLHWDRDRGKRAACGLLWSDEHDTGGATTAAFKEFITEDPPTTELCEHCVELFVDAAFAGDPPRPTQHTREGSR